MKLRVATSGLTYSFSDKVRIPPYAARYLASSFSPLYPKLTQIYAQRDPNTLWWRVSVGQLHDFKRVVRSWSARRARIAFKEALKKQGFDEAGRRIDSTDQRGPLAGSFEIHLRRPSLEQSFQEIQKDSESLLIDILAQLAARSKFTPSKPPKEG